jgi:hypothetical protein
VAQSTLDSKWTLDDSDKVFVLVQLSLLPTRQESDNVDMTQILLSCSTQESSPVGLKIGSQWHMATSGDCQIGVLGENKARFGFDILFAYPNPQGVNGGFTGSRQEQGTVEVESLQGALSMTFAYVMSRADVQAGGLALKLPGTQPVAIALS